MSGVFLSASKYSTQYSLLMIFNSFKRVKYRMGPEFAAEAIKKIVVTGDARYGTHLG